MERIEHIETEVIQSVDNKQLKTFINNDKKNKRSQHFCFWDVKLVFVKDMTQNRSVRAET